MYLEDTSRSIVCASDSGVVYRFSRAEISSNGGDNNTVGGITHSSFASPSVPPPDRYHYLEKSPDLQFVPANATIEGADGVQGTFIVPVGPKLLMFYRVQVTQP